MNTVNSSLRWNALNAKGDSTTKIAVKMELELGMLIVVVEMAVEGM